MSKKNLIRSTGIIGFATATSRVLGFVRDIVIAGFFGTAIFAQAFVIAFRIPNLLRDLVGEGATNSAFVPVLTDELAKKGKKDFFKLAQVVFNIVFWALLILTVLGMLAAPLVVRLIAPGFQANSDKFQVTVTLTRVIFPFLLLVGLWAYAMGVLNSLGHFAAPAFGSCVLNLSIILCARQFGENVFGLAAGVLVGGALQFLIQVPPLYLNGWKARRAISPSPSTGNPATSTRPSATPAAPAPRSVRCCCRPLLTRAWGSATPRSAIFPRRCPAPLPSRSLTGPPASGPAPPT